MENRCVEQLCPTKGDNAEIDAPEQRCSGLPVDVDDTSCVRSTTRVQYYFWAFLELERSGRPMSGGWRIPAERTMRRLNARARRLRPHL